MRGPEPFGDLVLELLREEAALLRSPLWALIDVDCDHNHRGSVGRTSKTELAVGASDQVLEAKPHQVARRARCSKSHGICCVVETFWEEERKNTELRPLSG